MLFELNYETSTTHNHLCLKGCEKLGDHMRKGVTIYHHHTDCFHVTGKGAAKRSAADEEWINSRAGRGLGPKFVSTRVDNE